MKESHFNKESDPLERQHIKELMEMNPVIDYLLAETIVRMTEDERQNLVKQHKEGTLIDPYPNKERTSFTLKTGKVEPIE